MKILVVDDSISVRKIIRSLLENAGYEVEEANSGVEALRQMIKSRDFDLVTLDVNMPKMDGFETCKNLRNDKYQDIIKSKNKGLLPIIFITGHDTLQDRKKGFELGATDFINKDFLDTELVILINRILNPTTILKGFTALVVDDSEFFRYAIIEPLKREGVSTVEAADGLEAFKILQQKENTFDVILVDYEMPNMTGHELLLKIRGELGLMEIPVIMISSIKDKDKQIKLFKDGVTDFLSKPFIQEELLARLEVHLANVNHKKMLKKKILELETTRSELLKANTEREELLHILCHDLANPFNAMYSTLDLLSEDLSIMEMILPSLQVIVNNGIETLSIVKKLRALENNKIPLALDFYNLNSAVEQSSIILQSKFAEKNISLEQNIDNGIEVLVDFTTLVSSILNNLFTNAIKFSERNSKILITAKQNKDMIEFSIKDFGIGMPEILRKKLFLIGEVTTRPGTAGESGTGFGMPLVKKFILAYGGTIKILSKEKTETSKNHGTEIILNLKGRYKKDITKIERE